MKPTRSLPLLTFLFVILVCPLLRAASTYPEALKLDPTFDLPFENELGGNITAVADAGGGKLLVAGDFVRVDGYAIRRLARFDTVAGTLDPTFAPAINGTINTILVQPEDGKILIGGVFNRVNGSVRLNIARLNPDGSTDLLFNPGSGASSTVNAIALDPAGPSRILLGGQFTNFNNSGRTKLVRLNADGSVDPSFNANGVSTSFIPAIVV